MPIEYPAMSLCSPNYMFHTTGFLLKCLYSFYKFQIFSETPDFQRKIDQLKSSDFRDAYPRFPPIQV